MQSDQADDDIRCEWGENGAAALAPLSDVAIVVDVLSFTTCVEIACKRGAIVYPWRWKDDSAASFARSVGAALAGPRGGGEFSLSPISFLGAPKGARIVLPSPNGSTICFRTGSTPTLAGCLRNAAAVARAAGAFGRRVAVLPAGERWPDGSLRPSLEDWLGAGAILARLSGRLSPEAEAAVESYRTLRPRLAPTVRACVSGRELIARGFAEDVEVALEEDVSDTVPVLRDGAFTE